MKILTALLLILTLGWAPAYAIQPWVQNPAYWEYEGEPVLLLGTSAKDHLFLSDGEVLPNGDKIKLLAHLNEMKNIGANYVRNVMSQREDWPLVAFHRFDGPPFNGKFDLGQFTDEQPNNQCNTAESNLALRVQSVCYWARFHAFLEATKNLGIFVQIEVWDRFDYSDISTKSPTPWEKSPWRPQNNVNYTETQTGLVDTYLKHPGDDIHPFFHGVPGHPCYEPAPSTGPDPCKENNVSRPRNTQAQYDTVRLYQEKFVDKMLSYSLNYDHVLYTINNETSTHISWGKYWMNYIKGKAQAQGKTVYVTDMFDLLYDPFPGEPGAEDVAVYHNNPKNYNFLDISQANSNTVGNGVNDVRGHAQNHWDTVEYIMNNALGTTPRPVNHVKIYDDGYFGVPPGPALGIHQLMNDLLLGAAGTRYHRLDHNSIQLPFPQSLESVRMVESKVRFWELEPKIELLSNRAAGEAFLAAKGIEKYVMYFPEGGSIDLALNGSTGQQFDVNWINYRTATWGNLTRIAGGGIRTVTAPDGGSWIAILTLSSGPPFSLFITPAPATPPRAFAWLRLPHEGEISKLPKSFLGEGSSRAGFEVAFECQGL